MEYLDFEEPLKSLEEQLNECKLIGESFAIITLINNRINILFFRKMFILFIK